VGGWAAWLSSRSLHGKLGVTSRTDAVMAGRRDGLIPDGIG
jgi:hypothetical protein